MMVLAANRAGGRIAFHRPSPDRPIRLKPDSGQDPFTEIEPAVRARVGLEDRRQAEGRIPSSIPSPENGSEEGQVILSATAMRCVSSVLFLSDFRRGPEGASSISIDCSRRLHRPQQCAHRAVGRGSSRRCRIIDSDGFGDLGRGAGLVGHREELKSLRFLGIISTMAVWLEGPRTSKRPGPEYVVRRLSSSFSATRRSAAAFQRRAALSRVRTGGGQVLGRQSDSPGLELRDGPGQLASLREIEDRADEKRDRNDDRRTTPILDKIFKGFIVQPSLQPSPGFADLTGLSLAGCGRRP